MLKWRAKKKRVENEVKKSKASLTGVENPMGEGSTLVTKTNLKGVITYANRNFANISEMPVEDLEGKAHSIIRHPDMPRSAFFDLWDTIKKGLPWRGMVVNRASSGNHYWVDANVSPIQKNGEVIGYMSVRRKPSREDVAAAESLYRDVREGKKTFPYSDQPRLSLRAKIWLICGFNVLAIIGSFIAGDYLVWSARLALALSVSGLSILFTAFILRALFRPLGQAIDWGYRIAAGDLTMPIQHNLNDETGALHKSMLAMLVNTAGIIGQMMDTAETLASSAGTLKESSEKLSAGSEETSIQSSTISSASTEMTQSLENISSSIEELSVTVRDVSDRANKAAALASQSSGHADQADAVVTKLGTSAAEISQVVEKISQIAGQTNLLSLNASIEAASAGEYGRGFAVVAREIKELARQSGEFSQTVKEQVEDIQKRVAETTSAIREIVKNFADVTNINNEIANSVEQQSQATKEVAGSIAQLTTAANEVSGNVAGIAETAEASSRDATHIAASAREVDDAAKDLHGIVRSFKI